ncbi:hypothetical protein E2562_028013 [Oryza meyeriana var. granulata]|uniref:BZIP domain-containing protein n=1 Tax=Oryza meyeriana var. granulata TaxID=110450 RepID=A0A6G1CU45_9ORYZ|nr:hypothetical protein E2562_028013 [Oryza meyeriana var. granulata]
MAMEDDEDMWVNTTSPSASPPRPTAAEVGFISTALSLNSTHLHGLLSSSFVAAASPSHAGSSNNNNGSSIVNGGYRNAAPTSSPASSFFSPASYHHHHLPPPAPLDAGRRVFDHDMSRARKQARVNNLETEVEQLKQENKMLRVKYEQLRKTVEVPVPVRRTLQRVLSAPF